MPLSEAFCDEEEDVDSLIGRRAGSSFSSMASLIYNPAVANAITPRPMYMRVRGGKALYCSQMDAIVLNRVLKVK